jgi:hypothetical protein
MRYIEHLKELYSISEHLVLTSNVYHIQFTASDGSAGGTCNGEVTVTVPHDQSGRQAVDQGKLFDSKQ